MLPFPCFEIEARFDPGMSGGMVIDQAGALCGLIGRPARAVGVLMPGRESDFTWVRWRKARR
jgi:hypothetical protein